MWPLIMWYDVRERKSWKGSLSWTSTDFLITYAEDIIIVSWWLLLRLLKPQSQSLKGLTSSFDYPTRSPFQIVHNICFSFFFFTFYQVLLQLKWPLFSVDVFEILRTIKWLILIDFVYSALPMPSMRLKIKWSTWSRCVSTLIN